MEALYSIDAVLETGDKSSTYKFALLAAIMDYIIENPAEVHTNGFHSIPIIYLAKQVTLYYYPMAWYEDNGIKQGSSSGLAIYSKIREKMGKINDPTAVFTQKEGVFALRDQLEEGDELNNQIVRMLILIRRILLDMPIKHIKIAGQNHDEDHEVEGFEAKTKRYSLFGLYNTTLTDRQNQDFTTVLNESMNWNDFGDRRSKSWQELMEEEVCSIRMGHYAYLQLVESRIYIRDVIIKRWIEFSVEKYLENDGMAVYQLINAFAMQVNYPEREPQRITRLRQIVSTSFGQTTCLYCQKSLQTFELDHFVPWSKYPVNAFWNLYPACATCNSRKSDKVLVIDEVLENRLRSNLKQWFSSYDEMTSNITQDSDGLLEGIETTEYEDYVIDHLKLVIKDLI